MTPADKLHFARIIARLAVAQREKDLDALTTRAYFEGLKDREIEFVEMAAERIAFTATWFPKLAEWRREAIAIEAERVESQKGLPEPSARAALCRVWRFRLARGRPGPDGEGLGDLAGTAMRVRECAARGAARPTPVARRVAREPGAGRRDRSGRDRRADAHHRGKTRPLARAARGAEKAVGDQRRR